MSKRAMNGKETQNAQDKLRWLQVFFGWAFVIPSTLGILLVLFVFFYAAFSSQSMVTAATGYYFAWLIPVIGLIGFVFTSILKARKEVRESQIHKLDSLRKALEIEKLRNELENVKRQSTTGKQLGRANPLPKPSDENDG